MGTETIWYPEEHTVAMASILTEGLNTGLVPEELAEVLEPQIEEMLAYADRMGWVEAEGRRQAEKQALFAQRYGTRSIPDIIRRKAEDGNGPDWKDHQ